jgi:type II secretory pathway predicted ATPase ExeA
VSVKPKTLQPVEDPSQWGTGLAAFRVRHGLSFVSLADACSLGGEWISKSSVDRLCRGTCEPRFVDRLRPSILRSLRIYLEGLKQTPAQIELELRSIFCKQEMDNMLTNRTELPREAQQFFGLKTDPFRPPENSKEEFTWPALEKIARRVEDAVAYQGFLAVIGDIGTGKTLQKLRISNAVKNSDGRLRLFWPKFYNMDRVHSGSIVSYLLRELGQREPRDMVSRAAKLEKVLGELSEQGIRVALGFDECHRLHETLIVALKNFWEAGSGGYDRYLGMVLFGWPRFEDMLLNHREIAERISIVRMPTLSRQASSYLEHRLGAAGGRLEKLFDSAAVSRMTKLTDTPQALGNVANAALLKAFELNERKVVANFVPEINNEPRVRAFRSR